MKSFVIRCTEIAFRCRVYVRSSYACAFQFSSSRVALSVCTSCKLFNFFSPLYEIILFQNRQEHTWILSRYLRTRQKRQWRRSSHVPASYKSSRQSLKTRETPLKSFSKTMLRWRSGNFPMIWYSPGLTSSWNESSSLRYVLYAICRHTLCSLPIDHCSQGKNMSKWSMRLIVDHTAISLSTALGVTFSYS